MLQPKKTKFRRQQKGRMKGIAQRGSQLVDIQSGAGRELQTDDFVIQKLHDQVLELCLRLCVDHFLQLVAIHLFSPPFPHFTAFRGPPQDGFPEEFINCPFISSV